MLNQNILTTIITALDDPTRLTMSSVIFKYRFIYYSSPLSNNQKKSDLFLRACANNCVDEVMLLLHYVNPSYKNHAGIRFASYNGHFEVVKLLLADKRTTPTELNNAAIRLASGYGHIEVVKLLLEDKRVNSFDDKNNAIQIASHNGHIEIVKLLLADQKVIPADNHNQAINWAIHHGHDEIVRLLSAKRKEDNDGGYVPHL